MKSSIVLAMFATVTLLACGKTDEAPAPAMDTPPTPASVPADTSETAAPTEAPIVPDYTPAVPPVVAVPATPATPPAAKSAAPVAPTPPAVAAAPKAAEAAPAAPKPDLVRGEQVYRQSCAVCHDKGVAGAPKISDTAAWSPRLARGMDAMYATALNGKGAMPPKGGNPALSETDVKAAVDYLAAQSR